MSAQSIIASCTLRGSVVRYLERMEYTIQGRLFRIVGTESTGRGVYDCIDTVKNDRGEYREFRRMELIELIEREGR